MHSHSTSSSSAHSTSCTTEGSPGWLDEGAVITRRRWGDSGTLNVGEIWRSFCVRLISALKVARWCEAF